MTQLVLRLGTYWDLLGYTGLHKVEGLGLRVQG